MGRTYDKYDDYNEVTMEVVGDNDLGDHLGDGDEPQEALVIDDNANDWYIGCYVVENDDDTAGYIG